MNDVCAVPCISCGAELRNFEPDGGNHPLGGLEFTTPGHYGSRLFDMERGSLVINICDDCLCTASRDGKVLHHVLPQHRPSRGKYKLWVASGMEAPLGGETQGLDPKDESPGPSGETPQ